MEFRHQLAYWLTRRNDYGWSTIAARCFTLGAQLPVLDDEKETKKYYVCFYVLLHQRAQSSIAMNTHWTKDDLPEQHRILHN